MYPSLRTRIDVSVNTRGISKYTVGDVSSSYNGIDRTTSFSLARVSSIFHVSDIVVRRATVSTVLTICKPDHAKRIKAKNSAGGHFSLDDMAHRDAIQNPIEDQVARSHALNVEVAK